MPSVILLSVAMKTPALLFATALSASAAQAPAPAIWRWPPWRRGMSPGSAAAAGSRSLLDDAACGREKLVRFLGQAYGPLAGYKAALTNPAVQRRFGAASPVRGVLFASMFLPTASRCRPPMARGRW